MSSTGPSCCFIGCPGRFLDLDDSVRYFERYFKWYNTEHLHSGIEYVTPQQCHLGLRDHIVVERRTKLDRQRQLRKELNRWRPEVPFTTLSTLHHVA